MPEPLAGLCYDSNMLFNTLTMPATTGARSKEETRSSIATTSLLRYMVLHLSVTEGGQMDRNHAQLDGGCPP